MGRKNKKQLASLLGSIEVVRLRKCIFNSSVLPQMINSTTYASNLSLDLDGEKLFGREPVSVRINFIKDDEVLAAPVFDTQDIVCQQPLMAYQMLMHMIERGTDSKKKKYFFYAFSSRYPAWVQFLLVTESLNQKMINYVQKKAADTIQPQPAFFNSVSPAKK